ncbi:hypothetical protein T484DRAFT_1974499, partial [Baffinella frigidus]
MVRRGEGGAVGALLLFETARPSLPFRMVLRRRRISRVESLPHENPRLVLSCLACGADGAAEEAVGGGLALEGAEVLLPCLAFAHRLEALRHDTPRVVLVEKGCLHRLAGALPRRVLEALPDEVAERREGTVGLRRFGVACSGGSRVAARVDRGKRGHPPQARGSAQRRRLGIREHGGAGNSGERRRQA